MYIDMSNMKPSVKIASIVAAVLITTGIVVGIVSFSFFGIDRERIAEKSGYVKEIEEFASNSIDNIKVYVTDRDVAIKHSNTNKIEVEYYKDINGGTKLEQNGSTISLESHNNFTNFGFSTLLDFIKRANTDIKHVIIRVPINYAGDFNIETTNGVITAQDYDKVKDVLFKSTNGRINANDIVAKSFKAQTSNSSITLKNISSQTDVSAQSRNGKIDFDNVVSNDNMNTSTTNSSIRLVNSSSEKITATSTNGSVEVDRVTGLDITMTTTNSRITGTIMGKQSDYSITSRTSNSTSNLPSDSDGSTGGKLVAQTTNGRIEVNFID